VGLDRFHGMISGRRDLDLDGGLSFSLSLNSVIDSGGLVNYKLLLLLLSSILLR
jgi:hypothetical protein